jgi:uracil-DNA glycosylase
VMELADVYEAYRADPAFDHLRTEHIVLVPGEGSPIPKIMIVGEAPGATENTARRPFVGASGQALRSLIGDSAELDPADYFITNVVKYRPPGNRTPTWQEIRDSLEHLRAEYVAIGSPPIVVAVGGTAKAALAPEGLRHSGVLSIAGQPFEFGPPESGKTVWVMIHPSYALRNRDARPRLEEDWTRFGNWFRKEFS